MHLKLGGLCGVQTLPRHDLSKYFRGVALHQNTDNLEPNGKSYTIDELL
jgi:hypothetical protein